MLRVLAKIFSVVFHPIFFPTYSLLFINWASPYQLAGLDFENRMRLYGIVAMSTVVFPVITIFLMSRLGFVKSFLLKSREERIIPLVAAGLFYFWVFMVIRKLEINSFITAVFLGASLSVYAAFFFNLFFKISLHTVGAGVFVTFVMMMAMASSYNLEIPMMVIIVFAGLLGTVRWYLNEHTGEEIFSGYAIGVISQLAAFMFIL